MSNPLVDAGGSEISVSHEQRGRRPMKQAVFDWSGVVGIVMAIVGPAMVFASVQSKLDSTMREVERLRTADDRRIEWQSVIVGTMATRDDVEKISNKLDALASEMRNARGIR